MALILFTLEQMETMRTGDAIYKYREGLGGTKKQQEGRKLDKSGILGSPPSSWASYVALPGAASLKRLYDHAIHRPAA
jgi:hypothetical protein